MARQIVLLSGAVSAGKTTLCDGLCSNFGFNSLKTSVVIQEVQRDLASHRADLQRAGDELDEQTEGTWVRDALWREAAMLEDNARIVVDSVRVRKQIDAIRRAFGARVVHIHLEAPSEVLARRYRKRKRSIREFTLYEHLSDNATERNVGELFRIADIVIDTNRCIAPDVLVRAASHLGLYPRPHRQLVDVIVGGQFGSEGKGHIAAYLAREYGLLVRVGGPNAGHKVYGRPSPYTFHQLPSGTGRSDARLLIGPGAVIAPDRLLDEIAAWSVSRDRLSIDPQAFIIEPADCKREQALVASIGSTGQGVGAATARRIMARGLELEPVKLARDVPDLKPFIREAGQVLDEAFHKGDGVLLEGTQGSGLSLYHGFYPHVTSRDTTISGCLAEAGIAPCRVRRTIVVCRTYPIRVQSPSETGRTSGPMSQQISWPTVAKRSGLSARELKKAEKTSTTNRDRRVGEFDWSLLRKTSSLNGPTDIALTFADYISSTNTEARRFDQLTQETIQFVEEVERVSSAPVSLISTRFHFRSIIDRRSW